MLLESDSFCQTNSEKVTLLTETLFKNDNKTGKLSQAVNSYNVDFVIALLLNEWDAFANYALLEGLVKTDIFPRLISRWESLLTPKDFNKASDQFSSKIITSRTSYRDRDVFEDPYQANLLFISLLETDVVLEHDPYFSKSQKFHFNPEYCRPSLLSKNLSSFFAEFFS